MSESSDTLPSSNVVFTSYEISLCLHDTLRTRMWKEAIEEIVKPGDVVVDAGSGTGILGVFAAMAGARKVYCIEIQPRFVTLIQHLAARNNLSHVIEAIEHDATTYKLPEPADVMICELLCTGQFFEPQVKVVNHLRPQLKPDARIIPDRVESFIRLLDAQEMLYGVRVDCDSRPLVFDDDEPVSSRVMYDAIDFSPDHRGIVDTHVKVKARKTRLADAVLIEGRARLAPDIWTTTTKFLYNPEVIFLPQPVKLTAGQYYDIHIRYAYGCDTLDTHFDITPSQP